MMIDKEKVIKGLEVCTKDIPMSNAVHKSDFCKECPYYNAENHYCWNQIVMMRDALSLLKKQEPRMLKLDEIKDGEPYWLSASKEFMLRPVICVHREDDAQKQYITFAWQFGTFSRALEDYDKTWRCWTAKPTDK